MLVIPSNLKSLVKVNTRKFPPFVVQTYSVVSTNNKGKILKRAPDDQTYLDNPLLVELVPRGCSDLFLVTKDNEKKLVATLRGLTKFDGTSAIDEDETEELQNEQEKTVNEQNKQENEKEKTVNEQREEGKEIFNRAELEKWNSEGLVDTRFVEKANGKFAIFTFFEHDGHFWIFGGSKNVHVPLQLSSLTESLAKNTNIGGNELHYNILRLIAQDLKKLNNNEIQSLLGKTFVGEYVDGKHIVFTDAPYMVYFDSNLPECFRKPKEILPTLRGNLPTSQMLQDVRKLSGLEGVVIEYWNRNTGQVLRQKHKTVWYIVLRSWRELICHLRKENFKSYRELSKRLKDRLHSRDQTFLHLDEQTLDQWLLTAESFSEWLLLKCPHKFSDVGVFSPIGMAVIWYLYETRNLESKEHNNKENKEKKEEHNDNNKETKEENNNKENTLKVEDVLVDHKLFDMVLELSKVVPVTVIMQGLPGTGKSLISRVLQEKLTWCSSQVFSTDEYFYSKETGKYEWEASKLAAYHNKNLQAFCNSKSHVRIVDNTNLATKDYNKYHNNAMEKGNVCVVLSTKDAPLDLLVKRNCHSVPLKSLDAMKSKFHPSKPIYVGAFFDPKILIDKKIKFTQQTPLHITCLFLGNNSKIKNNDYTQVYGRKCNALMVGQSENEHGVALVVQFSCGNMNGNHITLSTNPGSKPVDVGRFITKSNTILFHEPFEIPCVMGAMF